MKPRRPRRCTLIGSSMFSRSRTHVLSHFLLIPICLVISISVGHVSIQLLRVGSFLLPPSTFLSVRVGHIERPQTCTQF
jgi:hypothetical protein